MKAFKRAAIAALLAGMAVSANGHDSSPRCEGASSAGDQCAAIDAELALNDLQSAGSHNSYKRPIPPSELQLIAAQSEETAQSLDYAHVPLSQQLDMGMRQLELDVYYDPDGGHYADPMLPRISGEPFDAEAMAAPGFKVFHVADIDVRSHCVTLIACLAEIEAWSDEHPGHTPILILFNAKSSSVSIPGATDVLPFDAAAFDAFDKEVRQVLDPENFLEPDDVRGPSATLHEAIGTTGWPLLSGSRGQLILALDEGPDVVTKYMRGRASLEGLPLFVNSITLDAPHAAYATMNDPLSGAEAIANAVRAGILVRTRADADTAEARSGNTSRRDTAFASGAHYVSTDYYLPRTEWSDYRVTLTTPSICNPVRKPHGCSFDVATNRSGGERWLAGDHHIHSRYSVGWDHDTVPPTAVLGGDAIYPIPMNAAMARRFGLEWIVATDHGGPGHSKISHDHAYPELLESRLAVPEVIQFFGLELNSPGADHSSIIVPYDDDEAKRLVSLESAFDAREEFPKNPDRDDEEQMIAALKAANAQTPKPIVIAHHPSRSAAGLGDYGRTSPRELRNWNNTAPDVAIGMEGAPGHQATAQSQIRFPTKALATGADDISPRGYYREYPTMGGFDQMTARVGGFWDSMLGEGRRWWITANSDSHVHWRDGGVDFWPGEYSKTYVRAEKSYDAILASLRDGRIFVTTGDLVSSVDFIARDTASGTEARTGGTLTVGRGRSVTLTIRIVDPPGTNANGENPAVSRVDLIRGKITGKSADLDSDSNPTTRVAKRFTRSEWQQHGETIVITHTINDLGADEYIRLRGTNTDDLEPPPDEIGEDVWQDLWFYTNPIFLKRS